MTAHRADRNWPTCAWKVEIDPGIETHHQPEAVVRDPGSVGHHSENRTGFDGLSIDIDGAGAALRRVATDMGTREAEIISQQMNQELARFDEAARRTPLTSIVTT